MYKKWIHFLIKIERKIMRCIIKWNFKDCSPEKYASKEQLSDLVFTYRDENWDGIKYLTEIRNLQNQGGRWQHLCKNDNSDFGKFCQNQNQIHIHAPNKENNWLCFFFNDLCKTDFEYSFDITLEKEFKEIQVSFYCKDLGNRYRFMIQDNRRALFEIVKRGSFYTRVREKDITLDLYTKHTIRVISYKNNLQYFVDNTMIFSLSETIRLVKGTDIVLIVYNEQATGDIVCDISNIQLHRL